MASRGSISSTMQMADPSRKARLTRSSDGRMSAIHVGEVLSEIINLLERSASCLRLPSYRNALQPAWPMSVSNHANWTLLHAAVRKKRVGSTIERHHERQASVSGV